jgi:hypothetical protein
MIVRKSCFQGAAQVKFRVQTGYSRAGIKRRALAGAIEKRNMGERRRERRRGRIELMLDLPRLGRSHVLDDIYRAF